MREKYSDITGTCDNDDDTLKETDQILNIDLSHQKLNSQNSSVS